MSHFRSSGRSACPLEAAVKAYPHSTQLSYSDALETAAFQESASEEQHVDS